MTASASQQGTTRARAIAPNTEADLPLESSATSPQRHAMIAVAAFFIFQARGFVPGQELDDWLAAEREVDRLPPATEH